MLISIHIDKDPLEPIALPILTRIWQDVGNQTTTLTKSVGVISPKLLKLKEFCYEFFVNVNGVQRSFENDFNLLTLQVLTIFDLMIQLGFYETDEELIQILNPVISLLDGSNDFVTKEEEEAFNAHIENKKLENDKKRKKTSTPYNPRKGVILRYRNNEDNAIIFKIKRKIIKVLTRVIDIQNNIRLSCFLREFYKSDSKLMINPAKSGPELVFINNLMLGYALEEKEQSFKEDVDKKVIEWMRRAYSDKKLDLRNKS